MLWSAVKDTLTGLSKASIIDDDLRQIKVEIRKRMDHVISDWSTTGDLDWADDIFKKEHINADVAGTGITQGTDLDVNVDDTTVAISGGKIICKDDGFVDAKRDYSNSYNGSNSVNGSYWGGDTIGMMSFGGRVEIYVNSDWKYGTIAGRCHLYLGLGIDRQRVYDSGAETIHLREFG